ncbi:endonuclease/exonuclease/phosphatase family protein [Streptomyces sp. NPDC050560]|uniref:endonuclease/exonuclease/phosphatase family protein n=1 Tax=Streptomyces sp. NPDC050560 TaxID=3365630 RepID=UPI00378D39C7
MKRIFRLAAGLASVLLITASAGACKNDTDDTNDAKKGAGVVSGRIATLNVCGTCAVDRSEAIANVIQGIRPEIIGLQEACGDEVTKAADRLKEKYDLGYHIVKGPTGTLNSLYRCHDGTFGNYILVAPEVTEQGQANYDAGSSEKRGYVWAHTSLHGVDTRLVVTHLPQAGDAAARTADVKQLRASVAPPPQDDRPTVIVGDFNAQPSAPELKPLWGPWWDADPNCRSDTNAGGCEPTQLGEHGKGGSRKKFDYIWLDRRAKTRPSGINVKAAYTDHSLVYADLVPSDLVPVKPSPQPPIAEKACLNSDMADPCLHTDTLSGDASVQGGGHGFYVAPSRMFVGSNLAIQGIEWKSWGRPTARGEGWTASNDCDPNCGEGKPVRIKVEVEASTMKGTDGLSVYTCARARKSGKSWDSLGISGKVCVKTP